MGGKEGYEEGSSAEVSAQGKLFTTGIPTLDSVLKGGVPVGSIVLLLGEEGAGAREFAFTSIARISNLQRATDELEVASGVDPAQVRIPAQEAYFTMSRSKADVEMEMVASFDRNLTEAFCDHVHVFDFSYSYFKQANLPKDWYERLERITPPGFEVYRDDHYVDDGTSLAMVDVLEQRTQDGVVYVDSLTDLIINNKFEIRDVMMFMQAIRRMVSEWGGVIFFLLRKGALQERDEALLKDCFDAVIVFEWFKSTKTHARQRLMHFEKFYGVLPILDRQSIDLLSTNISYRDGFKVDKVERI